MGLTLAELVAAKTKEDWKAQFLTALQGVSYVSKAGFGTGSVDAAGVAAGDFTVVLQITTAGELGSAYFTLSTDGGATFGAPVLMPGGGTYVVGATGATVTFSAGPVGAGTSFEVGDKYSFTLTTPTFPVTAWQPGSTPLTLVENDAEGMEDLSALVANVARGGLLETAEDDWLDLLLWNVYKLTRVTGVATVGNVVLTDAAGAGPFTLNPGDVWVATAGGLRFNNVTGGTLTLNGTLTLSFRAEKQGGAYNVGGTAINQRLGGVALPGVTVSNPNPMGGSWITTAGADRELNSAARTRASNRWPALGVGLPTATYDGWAKAADASVNRTFIRASPTIPGQVDVFLASSTGTVSGGVVTSVQSYMNLRETFTTVVVAASAAAHAYTVAGTVYVAAGYGASAALGIQQNLSALNGGGKNTIGEELPGVPIGGTLYRAQIIEQIQLPVGVRNVDLASMLPAADVVLSTTEVAVLTCNIMTSGGNPATDLCIVEV
jgi:phage-related baseplate assembly protein